MEEVQANTSRRVALLFTRYPVATETFLEREVRTLRELDLDFDVHVLWPAPGKVSCAVPPTRVMYPWDLLLLFFWIPYWLVRRPRGMSRIATVLLEARRPNFLNFWETMLGMGFGILYARRLRRQYGHLHAVWSSAPATAAWVARELTGMSYSMAGHAYDLFEDGGDGLLEIKMPYACFFRTSMEAGRQRWIELGADPGKIHVIRRGLPHFPPFEEEMTCRKPVRILAVGRLVEKMGKGMILKVLSELDRQGMDFKAVIVGGGPMKNDLETRARILGISHKVRFTGSIPYADVEQYYRWADILLFGGREARSGDRAGFPNAIGEAMAWGLPVCATDVGAVAEGIRDGDTGMIYASPEEGARKVVELAKSPELYSELRTRARAWVEQEFDSRRNMQQLKELLEAQFPPT